LKDSLGEWLGSGFCGKMEGYDYYFLSGGMVSNIWDYENLES
jgi:hypothetical protein